MIYIFILSLYLINLSHQNLKIEKRNLSAKHSFSRTQHSYRSLLSYSYLLYSIYYDNCSLTFYFVIMKSENVNNQAPHSSGHIIVLSTKIIMLVIVTNACHHFFRERSFEQNHFMFFRRNITKTLNSSKMSFESS